MKKLILLFGICLVLFNCNNNDDDQSDPIIEEEPPLDLSFPDCLLSMDILEYSIIMADEPVEPRSQLIKLEYEGDYYYVFDGFLPTDVNVAFYDENCQLFCTFYAFGGSDCSNEFLYNMNGIAVVWTDPR